MAANGVAESLEVGKKPTDEEKDRIKVREEAASSQLVLRRRRIAKLLCTIEINTLLQVTAASRLFAYRTSISNGFLCVTAFSAD